MFPQNAAMWQQPQPQPEAMPEDIIVEGEDLRDQIEHSDGSIEIKTPDGGVIIDLSPYLNPKAKHTDSHEENLAEKIDENDLRGIAMDLIEGIEADDSERAEYLNTLSAGYDILGLKMEKPRSDAGNSSAPLEGMSTVKHPLLLEACLRYAANARGELLPAEGPAKVQNQGEDTFQTMMQAEALEEDFNNYLTTTASEYYPDTDKMLFKQGFQGSMFKKVYRCPLRQRPVSESVGPEHIIVNSTATDILNAARFTHEAKMRPSMVKRMQYLGVYRDCDLTPPTETPNAVAQKEAKITGVAAAPQRTEDQEHTIWECYCELDLAGFEHKKGGKLTGLPLPYKVTIDKNSRQILEIRRNWDEDDDHLHLPNTPFVHYVFAPGLGFYGIGLLQILGNTNKALTAAWRLALDGFMFANFPGGIRRGTGVTRQTQTNFRAGPGQFVSFEGASEDIRKDIMPLPYKEPGAAFSQFIEIVASNGQRLGGTAEATVGEGKQDAPVGTTLALIEQATKVMDAVHKRAHQAQAQEFRLLMKLFRADPKSLWKHNKNKRPWNEATLLAALENYELIPQADPNTPSHMHRLMKVTALIQLNQAFPGVFKQQELAERAMTMMRYDDIQSLLAPQQAQQPDPKMVQIEANKAIQQDKTQLGLAQIAAKAHDGAEDRKAKANLATWQLAKELLVHPDASQLAFSTMNNFGATGQNAVR